MSYNHTVKFFETKQNFTYVSDGPRDTWAIHKEDGPFRGDCEDFAMTLAYRIFKGFWAPLFQGKFSLYQVDHRGVGHMVLKIDGTWYDNIMKNPLDTLPLEYTNIKKINPFMVLLNYYIWRR